jgi:NADH/F420H2 dehydrogenase subunit C
MSEKVMKEPTELLADIALKQIDANTFTIERAKIVEACKRLRAAEFEHLTSITAIDWKKSWEVVYHITQYGRKDLVVLKVPLPYQDPRIPSVTPVWPGAGWHEREAYDLMGIRFIDNPDLRRILLPQDFEGHPLRKEVKYGNTS